MRPENELTILALVSAALFALVLLLSFVMSKLFEKTWSAVLTCAAILFVTLYLVAFYVGHPVLGLSVWHLVGVTGFGAVTTWIFAQRRKARDA